MPAPNNASFSVNLLPSEQKAALDRLGPCDTPGVFSYARNQLLELGTLYSVEGFMFAYASAAEIDTLAEDHGLIEFKNWASKNHIRSQGYYKPCGFEFRDECHYYVRLPNGLWLIQGVYNWSAPDPIKGNGLMNDPRGSARISNTLDALEHPQFDAQAWVRFLQISGEFKVAWRAARQDYRDELRKSGEAQKFHMAKTEQAKVARTQLRMNAVGYASSLKDTLDVFINSVNNDNVTPDEIQSLRSQLEALSNSLRRGGDGLRALLPKRK